MKVVLFGGSGLIGSALRSSFDPYVAVRGKGHNKGKLFYWDPEQGVLDPEILEEADLVISLSGTSVASYWTEKKKRQILESRMRTTALIAEAINRTCTPPKMWMTASAIGYYGSRGDEELTETTPPGVGFLAEVAKKWEQMAEMTAEKTRVVPLRFGVVLSKKGGALKSMLFPFWMGLGGKLGSGKQWMSWIALEEIPLIVRHLFEKKVSGPVNVVSLHPVTNEEFTKILGHELKRPTVCSVPKPVLRLLGGEMADELLLSSAKVTPSVLLSSGYTFTYPHLEKALHHILDKV